ncbi:hypothetical protein ACQKM9_01590 [Viridibacillus sp. NPDC093762]|uniref:hypothetical protein n=1 Tax=Viridibacillus sp. NPDC093762 TaxID=3390720 RepID=UPI003D073B4C
MLKTETWWESIFTGPLAHGIHPQKQEELEDESFLFFQYNDTASEENEQPS